MLNFNQLKLIIVLYFLLALPLWAQGFISFQPKISFANATSGAMDANGATSTSIAVGLQVSVFGFGNPTDITITVATTSGTIASGDYTLAGSELSGSHSTYTLRVPASTTSVTLSFTAEDTDTEGEEVTLTLTAGANVGSPNVHTISITDNDVATATTVMFNNTDAGATAVSESGSPGTGDAPAVSGSDTYATGLMRSITMSSDPPVPTHTFTGTGLTTALGITNTIVAYAVADVVSSSGNTNYLIVETAAGTTAYGASLFMVDSDGKIKVKSGTTLADQDYEIFVRATNNSVSAVVKVVVTVTAPPSSLISIINLDQLHAIRYDLNGNGEPTSGEEVHMKLLFALLLEQIIHVQVVARAMS